MNVTPTRVTFFWLTFLIWSLKFVGIQNRTVPHPYIWFNGKYCFSRAYLPLCLCSTRGKGHFCLKVVGWMKLKLNYTIGYYGHTLPHDPVVNRTHIPLHRPLAHMHACVFIWPTFLFFPAMTEHKTMHL